MKEDAAVPHDIVAASDSVDSPADAPPPPFRSTKYLKQSNTGSGDMFGWSVAISADGSTLAVGAPAESSAARIVNGDETSDAASSAGAVYVFVRGAAGWTQQAYVKASNSDAGDRFGTSLSISDDGSVIAVGAIAESSAAPGVDGDQTSNALNAAGAAYVFARSGATWAQQTYLKASNPGAGDVFGFSVGLSGDGQRLAVGAPGEASASPGIDGLQIDNAAPSAGAVYVFRQSGGTWTQEAYVKASNPSASDGFGGNGFNVYAADAVASPSVALSQDGTTLVVGAAKEGSSSRGVGGNQLDNTAPGAGAAYVFTRSGMTWTQQAYLKASNTDVIDHLGGTSYLDHFGGSVAISSSGNSIVVGAAGEDSAATGINGDQSDNAANWAGAAYVFQRMGTSWTQDAYLKPSNTKTFWGGEFGNSLAISGDGKRIVVSAEREDGCADPNLQCPGSGALYLFEHNSTWTQVAYLKATNAEYTSEPWPTDGLGHSVAMARDGLTIAGGAFGEDSAATGVGGDSASNAVPDSGAVFVFAQ